MDWEEKYLKLVQFVEREGHAKVPQGFITMENYFMRSDYEKHKPFVATTLHKGKPLFRLMLPEYYKEPCLYCHGNPKGEKDITGGRKEGGKLNELGGAVSFAIYK